MSVLDSDDQHVLNHCAKFLARRNVDPRHDFGQYSPCDPRARIGEAWRFPIIDSYRGSSAGEDSFAANRVTFVYRVDPDQRPKSVGVVGTFATLYEALPLRTVAFVDDETIYMAATCRFAFHDETVGS